MSACIIEGDYTKRLNPLPSINLSANKQAQAGSVLIYSVLGHQNHSNNILVYIYNTALSSFCPLWSYTNGLSAHTGEMFGAGSYTARPGINEKQTSK